MVSEVFVVPRFVTRGTYSYCSNSNKLSVLAKDSCYMYVFVDFVWSYSGKQGLPSAETFEILVTLENVRTLIFPYDIVNFFKVSIVGVPERGF